MVNGQKLLLGASRFRFWAFLDLKHFCGKTSSKNVKEKKFGVSIGSSTHEGSRQRAPRNPNSLGRSCACAQFCGVSGWKCGWKGLSWVDFLSWGICWKSPPPCPHVHTLNGVVIMHVSSAFIPNPHNSHLAALRRRQLDQHTWLASCLLRQRSNLKSCSGLSSCSW